MSEPLTGQVNTGDVFIWASYIISAVTLGGLALWTAGKLSGAKKRLNMLNSRDTEKTSED